MKCIVCNKEFESKRTDAKYCSGSCRVKANRNKTEVLSVTSVTDNIVSVTSNLPLNYGLEDCQCMHCQQNRRAGDKHTINHGPYKTSLAPNELNRVSLPGDIDYAGVHQC